jgi:regulator of protease activity HflC (stomatin/prohibitin superfamily)
LFAISRSISPSLGTRLLAGNSTAGRVAVDSSCTTLAGFWWTNPFTRKRQISLRVRNFNSKILKVNDAQGSPIEIAAVVVWQVVDSAKSYFEVDDYEEFVAIQSETAIRALAIRYPYDTADDESIPSLRGIPEEVARSLQQELQARLEVAGVEIIEYLLTDAARKTGRWKEDRHKKVSESFQENTEPEDL